VKTTSITRLCDTGLLTADASPEADHAIEALDSALAALENLRVRPGDALIPDADVFTPDETKQCIEGWYYLTLGICKGLVDVIVSDFLRLWSSAFFTLSLDHQLMKALPDIIDSPHISVDPAARLIYYNILFLGRVLGPRNSASAAKNNYIKCLQSVPAWHQAAEGTLADVMAALIMVRCSRPLPRRSQLLHIAQLILDNDGRHMFRLPSCLQIPLRGMPVH
jgi:hypothetical protein